MQLGTERAALSELATAPHHPYHFMIRECSSSLYSHSLPSRKLSLLNRTARGEIKCEREKSFHFIAFARFFALRNCQSKKKKKEFFDEN
jgi:hypothetical protein